MGKYLTNISPLNYLLQIHTPSVSSRKNVLSSHLFSDYLLQWQKLQQPAEPGC